MSNKNSVFTGKLVYLMGASGSGKDYLLRAITGDQKVNGVVVARRRITRKTQAGSERHVALSPSEFEAENCAGEFLFSWQAHGFRYGISREILAELVNGQHVLVNGSRQYWPTALAIYPELIPVYLDVAPDVLESRLRNRGRENSEEIAARRSRAREFASAVPKDAIRISNNGRIESAVESLLRLLDT